MVTMPPRHGKSELVTKRFPAWWLGRHPKGQVITASYNSDLARDFGRSVRNIVNGDRYANVFETRLAADSKAADRWNTNRDGAYVAAGVGTAVTGRGADLLIIDDPLKDRAEADSELQRDNVWNWYTSTAYTRLMPGGAVIVVQTRWHEDDLSGRLLEKEGEGGDKFHRLDLPAIDDAGEALWPTRYDVDALKRIQRAIGPRDWSALYQQQPSPEEGTYFKREWFKRHKMMPPNVFKYGGSDYAVSEDRGDYTEHALVGIAPDSVIYVGKDSWSKQSASDEWIESKLDLIKKHKPFCWFGEAGVIQKAVEPMLKRRMIERKVYCRIEWVPSIHDKPTRARSLQARAAMGLVSLPEGEEGDRMLNQLISFPAGKNDDFVDALGIICRAIDEAHPGIAAVTKQEKPKGTGYTSPNKKAAVGWR